MFAVFVTGGKQYLVCENDVIYVEKIASNAGENVVFDKVLMVDNQYGTPLVGGASVVCQVEKHGKQKKITVIKHISQKHHRRKHGHRQLYTKLRVISIRS